MCWRCVWSFFGNRIGKFVWGYFFVESKYDLLVRRYEWNRELFFKLGFYKEVDRFYNKGFYLKK